MVDQKPIPEKRPEPQICSACRVDPDPATGQCHCHILWGPEEETR